MIFPSSAVLLLLSSLVQAVDVYLHPSLPFAPSTSSLEDATAALSRHLGLEATEPLWDASDLTHKEESFVGSGTKSVLLVSLDEGDAAVILPSTLQHAFNLATPSSTPIFSLSSVLSTYLHRASRSYNSIFSSYVFGDLDDVSSLRSFFASSKEPSFAAVELLKLYQTRQKYGSSSIQYVQVVDEIRAFLRILFERADVDIAFLTFSAPSSIFLIKRDIPQESQVPLPPDLPPPQQPIGSVSTCFTSLDACNNGTSTCSGRGKCVSATKAGRTCFVCTCGVTRTGEGNQVKTTYWAGDSCERKDISGPFVLLFGTVLVIILLMVGAVSLLYNVGDQNLPSTLLATAVTTKKD